MSWAASRNRYDEALASLRRDHPELYAARARNRKRSSAPRRLKWALPVVDLQIDGSRVNVYRGESFLQASGSASASGLADAALRTKYRIYGSRTAGFAGLRP